MKILYYILSTIIILCISKSVFSQTSISTKPNFKTDFDSVYVYIYDGERSPIVMQNNEIDTTVVCELKLSEKQTKELVALLTGEKYFRYKYDYIHTCYSPIHGLVFFQNGKPYEWVSICFTCNQSRSNVRIEAGTEALFSFFKKLHLKVDGVELVPVFMKSSDDYDLILKMNEKRYGKDYNYLRNEIARRPPEIVPPK